MRKPVIIVNVGPRDYELLAAFIAHVLANMTGNLNFGAAVPSLPTITSALADLNAAIAAWGPVGDRGSRSQLRDLRQKALLAHTLITKLGENCMSVVPVNLDYTAQAAILSTSGFPLKDESTPQGIVQAVRNFHRVINLDLNPDQVKFAWDLPLDVTTPTNVKGYKIYRSNVNDFSTAVLIDFTNTLEYIDIPGSGTWFYWIVAKSAAGDGVISTVLVVVIS